MILRLHLLLDEIKRRSIHWWRIALVSIHTGMRASEVFRLRAQDVDLKGSCINVKDAKGGTRAAYLTPTAMQALAEILPIDPGALVFPSRTGGISREKSETFDRSVATLGLNKGVTDNRDKMVFHTLRHTFGSWAVQRGISLYVVAELMGHSIVEITKRYAKLSPDQKRVAMTQVEEMFHSATPCPSPDGN